MQTIDLPFRIFKTDGVFHKAFAEIMGFPGYYGCNWDAWIDCMSYIDDPSAAMTQVSLNEGELLEFHIVEYEFTEDLDKSDVFRNFFICAGLVNSRFKKRECETRLIISN